MESESIKRLVELFSRFPTVGPRTASRFVFYLLKKPQAEIDEFLKAVGDVREKTGVCKECFNIYAKNGDQQGLCSICKDSARDATLLCVVEKESDLEVIERTKTFHGLYFVLGGTLERLRKEDIAKLRIKEFVNRISQGKIQEIILALNPTTEGEATMLYLERTLKPSGVKSTRLARGIPMGGEVEYADEETLRQALEGRR